MAEVKVSSAHLVLNPAAGQNRLNKCESQPHQDGLERREVTS
jgi:hypothetical protein